MKTSPAQRRQRAFTLIELIVVISIIAVIAVFVIPAATTIVIGTELTRASQVVLSQFTQARQQAVTKQHPIEVRLIQFPDPEQPGERASDNTTWSYRAIQLMEILENGTAVALTKPERLPGSIIMNAGPLSSLLDESGEAEATGTTENKATPKPQPKTASTKYDPPIPRLPEADARKYRYVKFRFLADGSTDLPDNTTARWYVTLHSIADGIKIKAQTLSAKEAAQNVNFFTVQVDPASGSTRTFRPMAGATKS